MAFDIVFFAGGKAAFLACAADFFGIAFAFPGDFADAFAGASGGAFDGSFPGDILGEVRLPAGEDEAEVAFLVFGGAMAKCGGPWTATSLDINCRHVEIN